MQLVIIRELHEVKPGSRPRRRNYKLLCENFEIWTDEADDTPRW